LENSQMKKTLIAMAAVAVAGVASAQVTITGKLGVGVRDASNMARTMYTSDGGVTFSATEDLGGGMTAAASFTTSGMGAQGTDVGADGSSISLAGGFGKVLFGTATAGNDLLGVGSSLKLSADTAFDTDNSGYASSYAYMDYTLPAIVDGLTAVVRLANGSTANTVELTNEDAQWRLTYASGPVTATYNTTGGTKPASDMSVSFDAGVAVLKYAADTKRADSKGKRTGFSITAPVGGLTVAMSSESQAAYTSGSSYKKASANEFSVTYALSKRSSVNASWAKLKTTGGVEEAANTVKFLHTF
jgi:hypothetical protein